MSAIYILWLRELKRYVRSRAQIVASLGQPLLYLLALGFGLGPVFQQAGQGSYLQFIAPGVIGDDASCSARSSPASACCGIGSSASSKRRSSRPCRASTSCSAARSAARPSRSSRDCSC